MSHKTSHLDRVRDSSPSDGQGETAVLLSTNEREARNLRRVTSSSKQPKPAK